MGTQSLTTHITHVDRMVGRAGKVAIVLSLDCNYLTLLSFTSGVGPAHPRRPKETNDGPPGTKSRLRAFLLTADVRHPVEVEIGFVSPLDANAVVAIAEVPGVSPRVGSTLEFTVLPAV